MGEIRTISSKSRIVSFIIIYPILLNYIKYILFIILLSSFTNSFSQTRVKVDGDKVKPDNSLCKGCVVVTGNVKITQRGTKITCDKAIWDRRSNNVDATGNVKIYRSDSDYPLQGDKLFFDGNTSIARLRDNVYYKDDKVSFTTEKFDYNTKTEEGHYFDGGVVKDSTNTLISQRGYVFKNDDIIVKDSVVITTPDYLVLSDSIKYNSEKQMVYVIAPTTLYSDSSELYAEGGYYNTQISYAFLTDNAQMSRSNYKLKGDTIAYNETAMIGEGWGNIEMNDTIQKLLLRGHYMYHDGNRDYSFLTDSAQALLYSGFDTLYSHADTLVNYVDTAGIQYFSGYNNVRFFRLDVQGKCDSLVYNMDDETTTMYYEPMLWSLYNQMSGEIINIYNKNNRISHIEMLDGAFVVSREDSIRFNQIRGKTITGYISGNDLRKIQVDGSAESIYYSRDGLALVGYNQTESSYLSISMENGAIKRLSLFPASTGTFYSLDSKPYEEQFLRGFQWRSDLRPYAPWDIFRRTPREESTKKRASRPKRR